MIIMKPLALKAISISMYLMMLIVEELLTIALVILQKNVFLVNPKMFIL
jgi:hypothetical protein